jgi:hypothetical protein
MTRFLLASRELDADREKSRLPLVSRLFFEAETAVLKSMISKSQVWRVCQFHASTKVLTGS